MSTTTASPFKKQASNSEGGNYEMAPAGTHPAVLVGLIDLGTHTETFQGQAPKDAQKLYLIWELTSEHDSQGRPFLVGQEYTYSLGKKAKLRSIVEGFLGRSLADGEEYDIAEMIGKPCVATVKEGVTGAGKKYASLAGIGKPMKGLTVPQPLTESFTFALALCTAQADIPDFPEWIPFSYGRKVGDIVKDSKEYADLSPF